MIFHDERLDVTNAYRSAGWLCRTATRIVEDTAEFTALVYRAVNLRLSLEVDDPALLGQEIDIVDGLRGLER
jgi:hypothetical protein